MLPIEWTNQHGCGGTEGDDPAGRNCNMVAQYMCDTTDTVTDPVMQVAIRDGTSTNQVGTDGSPNDQSRGVHESAAYYAYCTTRTRNKGLFTADQNLDQNNAAYTRQNPNNNRRGLECPEERDYYPYWLPTPWIDIAYLTDHPENCSYIKATSQNTNFKYRCVPTTDTQKTDTDILDAKSAGACQDNGGLWSGYVHFVDTNHTHEPYCGRVGWSRENQLGNGRDNQPLTYNWTLPMVQDLASTQRIKIYVSNGGNFVHCVLRLRYNISTDDYDPWNTNASYNGAASPVKQNPTVDVGADLQGLKLAINTNQFGRTFQDRSHSFYIRSRPSVAPKGTNIYNLNVRGKRGNIVQTYPAVEYDFAPNRVHVKTTDFIHIQWTGSNTHNNGGGGGDGQTGDAGQGTLGTDRSNFVQLRQLNDSFPIPLDKFDSIFSQSSFYYIDGTPMGANDALGTTAALYLATSGFFNNPKTVPLTTDGSDILEPTLNNAYPSLAGGVLFKVNAAGTYNYMSTRNHAFSNRSQKGSIIVSAPPVSAA